MYIYIYASLFYYHTNIYNIIILNQFLRVLVIVFIFYNLNGTDHLFKNIHSTQKMIIIYIQ